MNRSKDRASAARGDAPSAGGAKRRADPLVEERRREHDATMVKMARLRDLRLAKEAVEKAATKSEEPAGRKKRAARV
jgi:hypothetical protein